MTSDDKPFQFKPEALSGPPAALTADDREFLIRLFAAHAALVGELQPKFTTRKIREAVTAADAK